MLAKVLARSHELLLPGSLPGAPATRPSGYRNWVWVPQLEQNDYMAFMRGKFVAEVDELNCPRPQVKESGVSSPGRCEDARLKGDSLCLETMGASTVQIYESMGFTKAGTGPAGSDPKQEGRRIRNWELGSTVSQIWAIGWDQRNAVLSMEH
ncbi:hypothetical protein OE88DRAFT_1726210 [Heliocybe sulcata]|uniref:Uncharacterized protein n=1 Tax=Heliocybe sulcata TaxID=5364 RepID=A0A5C3N1H5_9AGAM|nr:hypothetical protein OE88DRAFT_1726210 [Heliocybe sulcata]